MVTQNPSNEIHITRVYDAPVAIVWDAWTDPEQAAQWWGPRGFTLTTHSKDLRPGGRWHYTMHGPDGVDYPNITVYHEVEMGRKLVYDHGANDDQPPLFRVTVLFSEWKGKTKMEMTMAFSSPEQAQAIGQFIKKANGNSTWDRLAEYVGKRLQNRDCFVINRSFAASKEMLFETWTNPEHLVNWLPPVGFEMEFYDANIQPGGTSTFRMCNGEGLTIHGKFVFQELNKFCKIVYVQTFCDAQGNFGKHPALPVFPAKLLNTVFLTSEGDQATRVTFTSEPYGEATSDEVNAFLDLRPSMNQGWAGSFDQLESLLELT